MKRFIIETSPVILFLILLNYVSNNLRDVKKFIGEYQYYENNDTVMAQILNEVAANNTLLLFITILLVVIFVGVIIIINILTSNKVLLEDLKTSISNNQETVVNAPAPKDDNESTSNHTGYMPK